ncbi:MAG: MBL fold metallo-hydrolase [Candidatus Eisenbacteria bacterium]|nr:MBL fold metallo-hydrolase [Candidatus Eisenbacteria bacterium]
MSLALGPLLRYSGCAWYRTAPRSDHIKPAGRHQVGWTPHKLGTDLTAESACLGFAEANCYIVGEPGGEAVVVDPGSSEPRDVEAIAWRIRELGLTVREIVNTHGHPDHMAGNDLLKRRLNATVAVHTLDAMKLTDPVKNASTLFGMEIYVDPPDRLLEDGDVVRFGRHELAVLHTPGHSAGGIALLGDGFVLTGDTLFAGSIGRSDLPCSSDEGSIAYEVLMKSIRERLMSLPDETVVLPGHGPATTIGDERRTNPFVR